MKKYLSFSILLIASTFLMLYVLKIGPFNSTAEDQVSSLTDERINETIVAKTDKTGYLTVMEALRLGYEEAKKHTEEEPLLLRLTSTDDSTIPQKISDGANGKRNTWNVSFGSEKGNFTISMKIENGTVISPALRTDNNNLLSKGQFAISNIQMDSPEAIKEAIEKLDMRPGNPEIPDDWIKGYHFTIAGYLTDPNSFEKHWMLRIMGISPNSPNSKNESLRMNVFYDVQTGEVINATEMIGYDKEDRSEWKDVELSH